MRKIISLFSLIFIFACSGTDQSSDEHVTNHYEAASKDLVGSISKSGLLEEPYRIWYKKNYDSYTPDENAVGELNKLLNQFQIKAFMGTWCHDSQRETPRLLKILEKTNYDLSNLKLIALDQLKKTPEQLEKGMDIQRTPTFIIFKDDIEVGRIVEIPRESLEEDILKIITGQEYKHSYQ